MALQKSKEFTNGVVATYWDLLEVRFVLKPSVTTKVQALVGGWLTEVVAGDDKEAYITVRFSFTFSELGVTGQSTLNQTKTALQTAIKNSLLDVGLGAGFFNNATII